MGISRQEMKARCEAVYARAGELDEEKAQEIAPLLQAAVQGCTDHIMQHLNPIGKEEHAFLIVSMKSIIDALEKEDPVAGLFAAALSGVIGYRRVTIPAGSALEDAMRAMSGEGHDGREDK